MLSTFEKFAFLFAAASVNPRADISTIYCRAVPENVRPNRLNLFSTNQRPRYSSNARRRDFNLRLGKLRLISAMKLFATDDLV